LIRFLLRRLAFALLLVIAVSSTALLLTRLAPGDLTSELGPRARPEDIARARERFDLNRSPLAQLGGWAARAARFDFGDSFLYDRPVSPLIRRAAGNTAVLAVTALLNALLRRMTAPSLRVSSIGT